MARTHGWSGRPPADDGEAVRRILDATRTCIDRDGPAVSLSDVAVELQVTRRTVYRYFPSTEDLLRATAIEAAGPFLDRIERHLARRPGSPAAVVVEGVAYTLEQLPREPYIGLLLTSDRIGVFAEGFTAPDALELGRAFIERFPVDWTAAGFGPAELDGLVEQLLRTIQSLVLDPGTPPRRGVRLRRYLETWLAPPVAALTRFEC